MKPVKFSVSDYLMFYGFTAIMIQSESDYLIIIKLHKHFQYLESDFP